MSQYIWAVVFMHGLGMQVLALNSSAGKGHDLICISLGSFTSKLLWALKFTEKKSTHYPQIHFRGLCISVWYYNKKKKSWVLDIFLPSKWLPNTLCASEFGMAWPERAASKTTGCYSGIQGGRSSLHSSECRLCCFSWQTLLVPPLQSFQKPHPADSGNLPEENPVPCSAVPSVYHQVTHGIGALQTPQVSKQLLRTLPSGAAVSLN